MDVLKVIDAANNNAREWVVSRITKMLADLQIEAILRVDEGSFPANLRDELTEIERSGGLTHVKNLFDQVQAQSKVNGDLMRQVFLALDSEEHFDRDWRLQYPQAQARIPPSAQMNAQLKGHAQSLKSKFTAATNTDANMGKQLEARARELQLVSQGPRVVMGKCPTPASVHLTPEETQAMGVVRQAHARMLELTTQLQMLRNRLADYLEKQSNEAAHARSHVEVIERAVHTHNTLLKSVKENITQQDQAISALVESVPTARAGQKRGASSRDGFLKMVTDNVALYKQLCDSLRMGTTWHAQFRDSLSAHLERVQKFEMSRKMEKQLFVG